MIHKCPHEHGREIEDLLHVVMLVNNCICRCSEMLLSYGMIYSTWQTDYFQNDISVSHFFLFHEYLIKGIWLYLALTTGCTWALSQPIACELILVVAWVCAIPHEKVKKEQLPGNIQSEIFKFHYGQIRKCLQLGVYSFILRGCNSKQFTDCVEWIESIFGTGRALSLSLIFWVWADHGWLLVVFSTAVAITYPSASGVWSPHLPAWLLSCTSTQHGFASQSN